MPSYDLRVRVQTDSTTDPAGTLMNYLQSHGYTEVHGVQIVSIELQAQIAEPAPAEPEVVGDDNFLAHIGSVLVEIRDLLRSRL